MPQTRACSYQVLQLEKLGNPNLSGSLSHEVAPIALPDREPDAALCVRVQLQGRRPPAQAGVPVSATRGAPTLPEGCASLAQAAARYARHALPAETDL